MSVVMQELLQLLDLEPIEINLFRGQSINLFGKNSTSSKAFCFANITTINKQRTNLYRLNSIK